MKLEAAKILVDIIENYGDEATIYENYSGRGMYGKECAAISTSAECITILRIVLEHIEELQEHKELFKDIRLKVDNLGRRYIYY